MQVDARHVPIFGSRCWPLFLRLLRYQLHGRQRRKKGWGTEARYLYEEKCFCALFFFRCLSPSCFSLPSFPSGSNLLGWFLFSASWVFVCKIFPRRALRARRGVFLYEMKLSIWRRPTPLGSEKVGQFVELREGSPRILSLLACSGHAKICFPRPFQAVAGLARRPPGPRLVPLGGGWHQLD